jgi:hypothetical protein
MMKQDLYGWFARDRSIEASAWIPDLKSEGLG